MFRSLSRILSELGGGPRAAAPRRPAKPGVELLENRWVPSTIAGYVFNDAAATGLYQPTDPVYANNPITLLDSSGHQIGSTTTDANGHYAFSVNQTINTNPVTETKNASFGPISTESTAAVSVNQFDPSLGTLQSVEIELAGSVTSKITVQDLNDSTTQTDAETVQTSLSGDVNLQGPATIALDASIQGNEPDATLNAGQSHTFDPLQASNTQSVTITDPSDLAAFTGQAGDPGTVSFAANGKAQVNSDGGGGNLESAIRSTISGQVTVIYTYKPSNALTPGQYTVVETQNPPNTFNGTPTSNGVPVAQGTPPDTIPVTLPPGGDSLQNNFPKLTNASVSGFVYVDNNKDGQFDPGDTGIGNATVNLTGTVLGGAIISQTTQTAANGSYSFNVPPGYYSITQPNVAGYIRGAATTGNLGGAAAPGALTVNLPNGAVGVNYDFGELLAPPVTPPPVTPPPVTPPPVTPPPVTPPPVTPPGNPEQPPVTPPPVVPQAPPDVSKLDFFGNSLDMWGW